MLMIVAVCRLTWGFAVGQAAQGRCFYLRSILHLTVNLVVFGFRILYSDNTKNIRERNILLHVKSFRQVYIGVMYIEIDAHAIVWTGISPRIAAVVEL